VNPVIISLGGSLVVQDSVNISFLKNFRQVILSQPFQFIIVVGGGKTCRTYQQAAQKITAVSPEDLDWIGIASTHVNARLLRSLFGDNACEQIISNPTKKIATTKKIIIAGGWKPGWSTDYDAVHLAKTYGASTVINMTNVDYLYDKDPKEKGAKKIEKTDWATLKKIVGTTWTPGLNAPFDPVATKLASSLGLTVYIIGDKTKNLQQLLEKKPFQGTTIR
jgi:uridylate kinase